MNGAMSKIDCGDDRNVPCRCDPITGCGHASTWHRVTERWLAKCLVPDCQCSGMDVCNCCEGMGGSESDRLIAHSLGIRVDTPTVTDRPDTYRTAKISG